jgi:ubiquinol-cytochrome c reductase cytochrome c subunit
MRRLVRAKARYVAPAGLVACVAITGLLAFAPGEARAQPPVSPTGNLATLSASSPPTTIGQPSAPSVSSALKYASPSNQSGIDYVDLPSSFIAPGQALFASNCASCHGAEADGSTGIAPNLQGLGAGTVDFWVSTGRMPLANTSAQAIRKPPKFDRLQTLEIAAWVQSLTPGVGNKVAIVDTTGADLQAGNSLFTLNCAACHTITGAGDALFEGAYAPGLHLATTTQIVEAIRSGPGEMPVFSPGNITDTQARDIAAYVHGVIQHPSNPGGFALGGVGPVGEGFVGLLLGVGALLMVCFWIGDRT